MADGNLHESLRHDADGSGNDRGAVDYGDEEGEDDDEDGDMQMQIHPDLIAAAHKMGVELDSEQF